jgi:transglutaminase-like putative cysteine protease
MPFVQITHTTEYHYARPVRFTPHRAMLRPRDSHDLRLLDATLTLTPPAAALRWAHDVFGNSVCHIDFAEAESDVLRIVSRLAAEHYPAAAPDLQALLDPVAQVFPFSYATEEFPDIARSLERHYPDPDRAIDRWAHGFLNPHGRTSTAALLVSLTRAIRSDFRYEARDEVGTNPPTRTLATKSGACRDFALLMMEACRSLGMATRFVSGYLYDEALVDCVEPVVGGGATHAWVDVYLPGAGWVEFDPTNGLIAGRNLIRVCVARTPEQAVPLSGGYLGEAGDFMSMNVDVQVEVGRKDAAAPILAPVPA